MPKTLLVKQINKQLRETGLFNSLSVRVFIKVGEKLKLMC